MAEITPLRFKKDTSWEGENELPEYYTDADKRADLLKFLGAPDGKGGYIFDSAKWEEHQEKYRKLSAEYGDARKDYDDWVKEQEKKGLKLKDYENNSEFQKLNDAQKAAQAKLEGEFSGDMQALLVTDAPEVALNFLQVYGEVEKHPELKEKFLALKEFADRMIENGWHPEDGKNQLQLQYRDGQLLLRVNDLGGKGLHFAIKDDLSIVFTEDKTLKRGQVEELARVFDKVGMEVDNFSPTDKLKVVEDNEESKEVGSFENVFKSYSRAAWKNMELEELRRIQKENEDNGISNPALDDVVAEKTIEEEYAGQDYDADGRTGQTSDLGGADAPSYEGNPFADELQERDKDVSYRKMKNAIFARGGIMRIDRRCITTRRMPDGSMVISFYGSEQDKMKDGKLDKDGIAQHTKKCSFRMWNTRPPRIGIYVPQGGKFESGYAKGALGAMKACGYDYFFLPPTSEFGGDAQSAFLEAAGDQLMVPLCKRSKDDPKGCKLDADHWRIWIKAIDDPEKGSKKPYEEVLQAKMRAIGEINAQLSWDTNNRELDNIKKQLEGDVKMFFFQKELLPALTSHIAEGIKSKGWNDIDTTCAYAALAKVAKAIEEGKLIYRDSNNQKHEIEYKRLNPGRDVVNMMFVQEMAAARQDVLKAIEKSYEVQTGTETDSDGNTVDNGSKFQIKFGKAVREIKNKYYNELAGEDGVLGGIKSAYGKSEVCKGLDVKKQTDMTPPFGDDRHPLRNLKEPDLSHISSNAQAQYNNVRRTTPSPTRGGNTGYTGR